jgi:hypothetical protein
MTVEIIDDVTEVEKEIKKAESEISVHVRTLEVVDRESYESANLVIERIDMALSRISEVHDPVVKSAHETHKAALAAKKKLTEPLEALRREASRKMTAWYQAEQKRIADIRRAEEEKARKEAEERRLAEAEELAKAGMKEAADAALEAPLDIKTETFTEAPAAAAGVSYRSNWKAEVVDMMSLIKAVAAGNAPAAYHEPNMTALNGAAKAFKNTVQIPGVRQINETVQAKRKYA